MVTISVNDVEIKAAEGDTILEAARSAGIYIPALCAHPDLPPAVGMKPAEHIYRGGEIVTGESPEKEWEGCQLCTVEVQGMGLVTSCSTAVSEGMVVSTQTAEVIQKRQERLAGILARHPHTCLTCAQMEGCSREPCSSNVPVEERCCPQLGNCELQKVVEYVGIRSDTPRWIPTSFPIIDQEPLFIRNYNLCIGCNRCVRICQDVRGVGALGFVYVDGKVTVGPVGATFEDSACKFCGACVEVCPTGALTDKKRFNVEQREAALVPCANNCPAGIDIPSYINFTAEGKYDEALAVIREKVPFPSILGRVCHHPCESECRRGELNDPMSIRAIKRFVAGHDAGLWRKGSKVAPPTNKRVAIVGSGPAGLTAAYYLAKCGHDVTVFEASAQPGGMMRMGIPEYRLPRDILQKEIDEILNLERIELRTNTPINGTLSLSELKNQGYDAIFLATGANVSRKINIEGAELDGVLWGLDFLRDVNLGQKVEVGDRVLVIGGGAVAIDTALCALRSGAKEVQLACLEAREEMPAHEWEIQDALQEGVTLNVSWGPKRVVGDDTGKVKGMELVRCISVFDGQGKFNPSFDEETTKLIDTDMVILSIGQASDLSFLGEDSGIQVVGGTIKAREETSETTARGIFAGGDVVSGPASVIGAIAAGRKAACSIDKFLGGEGNIDEILVEREYTPWLGKEEGFACKSRVPTSAISSEQRGNDFAEIDLGFDEENALAEANRCLKCNLRLQISPVTMPPEEWLELNAQNVATVPEIDGVFQLLNAEKEITHIKGTSNLRKGLEEHLDDDGAPLGEARYFGFEEEPMYTARESELIQQFIQKYGRMPSGGDDDLDDLF